LQRMSISTILYKSKRRTQSETESKQELLAPKRIRQSEAFEAKSWSDLFQVEPV